MSMIVGVPKCYVAVPGEGKLIGCVGPQRCELIDRVFVSSVMKGFKEYREAARSAITVAGGTAVLVEDFPSLSSSPRNACLDGVRSCDAIAVIIGSRGILSSTGFGNRRQVVEAVRRVQLNGDKTSNISIRSNRSSNI